MQNGRAKWLGAFVFVVLVIVALWSVSRPQSPVGKKVVLADGTELTLHAITYRKTNDMTYGRPWERLAARVPDRLAPKWNWVTRWRAGVQKVHLAYPEDTMVLWFVGVFPTNAAMTSLSASRARIGFQPAIPWRIAGPEGSESGGDITPGGRPGGGPRLVPVAVESYPRRLADITFRIYGPARSNAAPGSLVLAGEFVLRNPKIRHDPFWTPAALPIRLEEAGVTCVLAKLEVLPPEANSPVPPRSRTGAPVAGLGLLDRLRFEFELFENGEPAPQWALQQLSVLDPTGNQLNSGPRGTTLYSGGRLRMSEVLKDGPGGTTALSYFYSSDSSSSSFSGDVSTETQVKTITGSTTFLTTQSDGHRLTALFNPLWLDEPAWKIRVVMVRTDHSADTRMFEFLVKPEWVRTALTNAGPGGVSP